MPRDLVAMSVEREAETLAVIDQFASGVKFGGIIGTQYTIHAGVRDHQRARSDRDRGFERDQSRDLICGLGASGGIRSHGRVVIGHAPGYPLR